jgi:hypothetical protein
MKVLILIFLTHSDTLPRKSPTLAICLSLIPGGGQFYTENYLKGVVFGGVQLFFGWSTFYFYNQAEKMKKEKPLHWEFYYRYFRTQFYNFLWWDAFIWAIVMADAYVSAHFYKFEEQGKMRFKIEKNKDKVHIKVEKRF